MVLNIIYCFIGIFVAMDIIGILPMYLGLTSGVDRQKRQLIIKNSILVATGVAFLFAYIGQYVFQFLGIKVFDFQIAGGIVLFIISIMDLIGGPGADQPKGSTGVVPLAVPLITGPGVITTVMLQVGIYGYIAVSAALIANFLFAYFALKKSALITRIIGEGGSEILSKIASLLLTAIACSMIRMGLIDAIKQGFPVHK